MYDLKATHPDRFAIICKHKLHLSVSSRILWCPLCAISAAQDDLEQAQKKLESEGGTDAPTYMRDCAWNVARLRHDAVKRRVIKTMEKDWQRQGRERLWEDAHQRYVDKSGKLCPDLDSCSPCTVCARLETQNQRYAKPFVALTTAWWERETLKELVVPETPPRSKPRQSASLQRLGRPSYLAELIKGWRLMRTVSNEHRRVWEDRHNLDRAVRQKYDLPDDLDLEPEVFAHPLSASHAKHYHQQAVNSEHAAERRTNRLRRRAEDFRPSRSSLALSELVDEVETDEAELERLRLDEEDARLQRMANVVETEVGYLYFVGEADLLDLWENEFERSDPDLVQRRTEKGTHIGQVEEFDDVDIDMEL